MLSRINSIKKRLKRINNLILAGLQHLGKYVKILFLLVSILLPLCEVVLR